MLCTPLALTPHPPSQTKLAYWPPQGGVKTSPPPPPQAKPSYISIYIYIHLLDGYLISWIANLLLTYRLLTYRPLTYCGQLVCASVKVVAGSQGKGAAHTQNKMAAPFGITLQPTRKNTAGMQLTSSRLGPIETNRQSGRQSNRQ